MIQLLVIADDFTGALDTGVQFSKADIATFVTSNMEPDLNAVPLVVQALVVNATSRHLPPGQAASKVQKLVHMAIAHGIARVYKKTDSTLRGNIGAELGALMNAFGGQPVMFIPAYPTAGRTTVDGRQYVFGVPLEQTSFAQDPLNPMETGDIAAILNKQTNAAVRIVKPCDEQALDEPNTIYVFDGESEKDLRDVGDLLRRKNRQKITAGCAGFAAHLADHICFEHCPLKDTAMPAHILLVCGSVNEQSLKQLRHAAELGYQRMTPGTEALSSASFWYTESGRKIIYQAVQRFNGSGKLAIQSILPQGVRLHADRGDAVAKSMGVLAGEILKSAQPCTLVVFGGDTAMEIMDTLGCTGLMPMGEIEPGVAVSAMHSDLGQTHVISKAGGLGSERVLHNIDAYMRRKQTQ